MFSIVKTVFEIAFWLFPVFLGLIIAVRSRESYEDSYSHSYLRNIGLSVESYLAMFRIIGVALILFGATIFFFTYIWEQAPDSTVSDQFWEDLENNKQKKDKFVIPKQ